MSNYPVMMLYIIDLVGTEIQLPLCKCRTYANNLLEMSKRAMEEACSR